MVKRKRTRGDSTMAKRKRTRRDSTMAKRKKDNDSIIILHNETI
jgi:hypothetical protein